MKIKIAISLTFLLWIALSCSAQKINAEKGFGGYRFTQNGKVLKINQLATKVSGNAQARRLMQSAKSKITISSVLSGVGGFLIGFPIGYAIGGGEAPNWLMAAGGAVLVGVGLPIGARGYKQVNEAVKIYNKELGNPSGAKFKPQFHIAASPQSVGLLVRF